MTSSQAWIAMLKKFADGVRLINLMTLGGMRTGLLFHIEADVFRVIEIATTAPGSPWYAIDTYRPAHTIVSLEDSADTGTPAEETARILEILTYYRDHGTQPPASGALTPADLETLGARP